MVTMPPRKRFELVYPPIIRQQLKLIDAKYYSLIRGSLESQLQFEPDVETRNRKPLKRPVAFGAKWEVRFGPGNRLRVFYRVDHDNRQVIILAIGEKIGDRLLIGGEEVEI
jgi:mRNA-degrading endonuclease RelE of RelBE toxin-antitoxin system